MLLPICGAIFAANFANYMIRSLLPLYFADLGITSSGLGLLISTALLWPLAAAIPIGQMVDRWGAMPIIRWMSVAGIVPLVGILLYPGMFSGWLVYAVIGLTQLGTAIALQAVLGTFAAPADRERQFGTYSATAATAQLLGPAVAGGVVEFAGYPFMFAAAMVVVAAPLGISFLLAAPARPGHAAGGETGGTTRRIMALLGEPGLRRLLWVGGLAMTVPALVAGYVPYYLKLLGYSPGQVGLLLSVAAGASILARMGLGFLVMRIGRPWVLRGIFVVGIMGLGLLAAEGGLFVDVASMVLVGAGGSLPPLIMAMVTPYAAYGDVGLVMGLQMMSFRVATSMTPMIFSAVAAFMSMSAALATVSASLLLFGWAVLGAPRRRSAG